MSKRNSFRGERSLRMRPLVVQDLPEDVQIMIKKRAWIYDITYEEAAVDILHDVEIDRIARLRHRARHPNTRSTEGGKVDAG